MELFLFCLCLDSYVLLKKLGLVMSQRSHRFMAIGLDDSLSTFRLRGALTRGDQALLVLILAFTVSQISTVLPLLGRHPSLGTMLLWLSDPLLSLL